jgi:hypothetical protein
VQCFPCATGAMDDTLLQKLASGGINTFSMNSGLTENDFGWGSANFHKMVCAYSMLNHEPWMCIICYWPTCQGWALCSDTIVCLHRAARKST